MNKLPPVTVIQIVHFLAIVLAVFVNQSMAQPIRPHLRNGETQTALDRYLQKPDRSYNWTVIDQGKINTTDYAALMLTSQTWKGITWKHQLYILKPGSCEPDCTHGLLLVSGGSWRQSPENNDPDWAREAAQFARIAEQLETPMAVLRQVPNQPIFDGKYEDEIIAYTFEQFIDTGDSTWPLLLPMVKSAHRALDATTEYAAEHWELELKSFTTTGASKRGWTSWLTGATDNRVTAIAPMVIDVLNMKAQMDHQKNVWGKFSEQIRDYTERGLQDLLSTDEGAALREIVDPFCYRDRLTQPKLIFIGTNDPYWPIDALQFYWNDLRPQKYAVYVPNKGHGLEDFSRILGGLNALQLNATGAHPLPEFDWQFSATPDGMTLTIDAAEAPRKVQVWSATSSQRDFRNAKWAPVVLEENDSGRYQFQAERPQTGSIAFFGECVFNRANSACFLSTNVQVLEAKSKPDTSLQDDGQSDDGQSGADQSGNK